MDRRSALQGLVGIAAAPSIASAVQRPDPTRTADVIVVGAGFAGLAATKALRAAGLEPLVVEARDRVGGRTCPGSIAGLTIDLGGMWVGPTQTALDALAREYGVKTYPQYLSGKSAIELNGKWRSSEGEDYGALLSLPVKLDVAQVVYRLTALSDSINPDSPWTHPKAEAFDAMTLQTWLDEHTHTEGAMSFMVSLIRAVFCAEPGDLSFLFCLFYLRSGGNLEELTTVRNGAQQRLFVGGVHQLSQRMADQLGERVILNSPVTDIDQDADGVKVTCPDASFRAKALIIAIAPALGRSHQLFSLAARQTRCTHPAACRWDLRSRSGLHTPHLFGAPTDSVDCSAATPRPLGRHSTSRPRGPGPVFSRDSSTPRIPSSGVRAPPSNVAPR